MDQPIVKLSPNKIRNITEDRPRKRRANPSKRKVDKRKKLRDSGQAYLSRQGKLVNERVKPVGDFECKCHKPGCKEITAAQKLALFNNFYKLTYDEQTLHLMESVYVEEAKRRRKGKNEANSRRLSTFSYKVCGVSVCKSVLLHIFDVSHKRLQTVQNHVRNNNFVPTDGRGKHRSHSHSLKENIKQLIRDHLKSFPRDGTYYSHNKSEKEYLSPDLNLSAMFEAFKEKHPNIEISKILYQSVFDEMGLQIGVPRETSRYCDSLCTNIICSPDLIAVHQIGAKAVFKALK